MSISTNRLMRSVLIGLWFVCSGSTLAHQANEGNVIGLKSAVPGLPAAVTAAQEAYTQAWRAQSLHDFDEALRYAQDALATAPNVGEIWLLQANLGRLLGKLELAAAGCNAAADLMGALPGLICRLQISPERSVAEAQVTLSKTVRLLQLPAAMPRDNQLAAWMYSVVSELAVQAQQLPQAEFHAQLAFALVPSVQNRVALAQVLLAQKKSAQALDYLQTDSMDPAITVTRLIARRQWTRSSGNESSLEFFSTVEQLDTTFRHAFAEGDLLHGREMVQFYLDVVADPKLALLIAEANWETQKSLADRQLLEQAETAVHLMVDEGPGWKSVTL